MNSGAKSKSNAPIDALLRAALHIVDEDGVEIDTIVETLRQISANTALQGYPTLTELSSSAAAESNKVLVPATSEMRIVVMGVSMSALTATNLSLTDQDGSLVAATCYLNDKSSFMRNFPTGLWLKKNKSLCYSSSAANQHTVQVFYLIV